MEESRQKESIGYIYISNRKDSSTEMEKEKIMEKRVDAMGMTCPKPVILAKKEMDKSQPGDVVIVQVDNEVATENLRKLANSQEADYEMKKLGDKHYEVKITVKKEGTSQGEKEPEYISCVPQGQKNTVVVISSDKMGEGDPELGEILIKGFIYSLTQLEKLPDTVLFYNKGAFLTCEGSPALEDLKTLEKEGTKICTCGTCLDFYKMKEKLAVGTIVNMYVIVETQSKADLIIKP